MNPRAYDFSICNLKLGFQDKEIRLGKIGCSGAPSLKIKRHKNRSSEERLVYMNHNNFHWTLEEVVFFEMLMLEEAPTASLKTSAVIAVQEGGDLFLNEGNSGLLLLFESGFMAKINSGVKIPGRCVHCTQR